MPGAQSSPGSIIKGFKKSTFIRQVIIIKQYRQHFAEQVDKQGIFTKYFEEENAGSLPFKIDKI